MHLITLIFIFVLIWYLNNRWKNRAFIKLAKQLKNDSFGVSLPIIGQSYIFRGSEEDRMKTIIYLGKKTTENGGIVALWHMHRLFILVSDAEIADILMRTCLEKDDLMVYLTHVLGNGSIFAPVPIWRKRRKAISPIFSQANLNQFTPTFAQQSEVLADRLRKHAGAGPFSLWSSINAYSLDAICETTFGVSVDALSDSDHSFLASFKVLGKMAAEYLIKPYLYSETVFKILAYLSGIQKYTKVMSDFCDNVIREKRQEIKQPRAETVETDFYSPRRKVKTFLDLFMESSGDSKLFTNVELNEEAMVILIAATDTSSVAASFTTMMLARHPDVQEKVYQEIREVLGPTYRTPTSGDLPRLKYMEAVIKETMRLYPPVPIVVRRVHKDITLPTGVTLLKGCGIVMGIQAIHRNPKYWGADADSFKPERFLDIKLSHPAAYMPFSYGPRSCAGYKYGLMSMKTVLATLLQQYRFLPAEYHPKSGLNAPYVEATNPLRIQYEIMSKEVEQFSVRLESRQFK